MLVKVDVSVTFSQTSHRLPSHFQENPDRKKIITLLYPSYHTEIIGHCVLMIMLLVIIKMERRSHKHDINRPRPGHGYSYTKYKKLLNKMYLLTLPVLSKLSTIWKCS